MSLGEQGREHQFSYREDLEYLEYARSGISALPVPIGGVLTQYQLLEGMLIGSASNYADFLVRDIWGDNVTFAAAAVSYVSRYGLHGISMVEPTGIDRRNTATPSALIALGRHALSNDVISEIVVKLRIGPSTVAEASRA